jgi:hypothetical protein
MLGESIEDRANHQSGEVARESIITETRQERNIPRLTRLDRRRLKVVASEMKPLIEEIPEELDDLTTGAGWLRAKVSEFDEEEEKSA